jgi:hypothetical protein
LQQNIWNMIFLTSGTKVQSDSGACVWAEIVSFARSCLPERRKVASPCHGSRKCNTGGFRRTLHFLGHRNRSNLGSTICRIPLSKFRGEKIPRSVM